MSLKKSTAQHCENNILYIPSALHSMRDIKLLLHNQDSAIFYKALEQDLINVEFHTSAPCIVYIETGTETITNCYNHACRVQQHEAVFLPKGLNLYSDYISTDGSLRAYLLFLSDDVVTDFLATGTSFPKLSNSTSTFLKVDKSPAMALFFESLIASYRHWHHSPHILKLKLLEILHIIDINDEDQQLRSNLSVNQQENPKRNIKRLMEKYIISHLSAKDFAALSGRSVSSFNREFKALYGTTPKQWIIEQRLAHAYTLLVEQRWSVTAVANEVGYDNISHFITAFKRVYHQTPHQIKTVDPH
ncbi:AraC family transcriptional regulator [Leptothoe sp. LEGE 181152]|nr:AraC family transcriptional regulator [Leptothoe sp. LEGE 181152]